VTVIAEIPAITGKLPAVMAEIIIISISSVPGHFVTIITKIVAIMTDIGTVMSHIPAIFPTALRLRSNTGKQTSGEEYK